MKRFVLFVIVLLAVNVAQAQNRGAQTRNNVAAQKLRDASNYWCPTNTACNPPAVKQCRADLTSWNQADHDWKDEMDKVHCVGCALQHPRPVELLSTEELYRRKAEASMCLLLLARAGQQAANDKALPPAERGDRFQDALLDQLDMGRIESELLEESLSRATSVIDSHYLWEEFLAKGRVK